MHHRVTTALAAAALVLGAVAAEAQTTTTGATSSQRIPVRKDTYGRTTTESGGQVANEQARLDSLRAANLAVQDDQGLCRFAAQGESRRVVDELATAYARDLIGITDLIHSQTERRAMRFANAFRWRKD